MKAKGKAATIDIVCNILSPFAEPTINDNANADCIIPHTNFLELGGFRSPLCDSIPNTNVAEFADVMKNVNNSAIAITDITLISLSTLLVISTLLLQKVISLNTLALFLLEIKKLIKT